MQATTMHCYYSLLLMAATFLFMYEAKHVTFVSSSSSSSFSSSSSSSSTLASAAAAHQHHMTPMTSLSPPVSSSSANERQHTQKRSAKTESPRGVLSYRSWLCEREDQEEKIRKILKNFGYFEFPTLLHRIGERGEMMGLKIAAANGKQRQKHGTPFVLPPVGIVRQEGNRGGIEHGDGAQQPQLKAQQEPNKVQERRVSAADEEQAPIEVRLRPLESMSPRIIWTPRKASGQRSSSKTNHQGNRNHQHPAAPSSSHGRQSSSSHSKSRLLNDLSILDYSLGSAG